MRVQLLYESFNPSNLCIRPICKKNKEKEKEKENKQQQSKLV